MKAQEFSQFKDQKELTDWLIENHKIEGRKGALAWMREHVPNESVYQRAILDYLRKEPGVWAYKAQIEMPSVQTMLSEYHDLLEAEGKLDSKNGAELTAPNRRAVRA